MAPIVTAAISRLAGSGLTDEQLALLHSTDVTIRDLPSDYLGYTNSQGHVLIDVDAAGHGWFNDATPSDDAEFTGGVALAGSAAGGQVDLVTVVMHELQHILDIPHSEASNNVMAPTLDIGSRPIFGSGEETTGLDDHDNVTQTDRVFAQLDKRPALSAAFTARLRQRSDRHPHRPTIERSFEHDLVAKLDAAFSKLGKERSERFLRWM